MRDRYDTTTEWLVEMFARKWLKHLLVVDDLFEHPASIGYRDTTDNARHAIPISKVEYAGALGAIPEPFATLIKTGEGRQRLVEGKP